MYVVFASLETLKLTAPHHLYIVYIEFGTSMHQFTKKKDMN